MFRPHVPEQLGEPVIDNRPPSKRARSTQPSMPETANNEGILFLDGDFGGAVAIEIKNGHRRLNNR